MKRILIVHVLLCLCAAAGAQKALFDKYADAKGVTSVYISKTMLSMAGSMKTGRGDIGRIAGKLDRVQILTCERPSMIPAVRKAALDAFKKEKFEQIMQVREDGDNVTIFQKVHTNRKNEFSLLNVSSGELQVINVLGNVTLKEIKDLASQ